MAENILDQAEEKTVEKGTGRSKKMYALVFVVIVFVAVIGFLLYSGFGDLLPFMETITNPDQASNTLSELGNDLSGISDDLKDMENIL